MKIRDVKTALDFYIVQLLRYKHWGHCGTSMTSIIDIPSYPRVKCVLLSNGKTNNDSLSSKLETTAWNDHLSVIKTTVCFCSGRWGLSVISHELPLNRMGNVQTGCIWSCAHTQPIPHKCQSSCSVSHNRRSHMFKPTTLARRIPRQTYVEIESLWHCYLNLAVSNGNRQIPNSSLT